MAVPREKNTSAFGSTWGAASHRSIHKNEKSDSVKVAAGKQLIMNCERKIYFSKLKVQNLRQFIPYSREQQIEEANRYLRKHLFEI